MSLRVHRGADDLARPAVRLIVVALTALVLYDVPLRIELCRIEGVEQEAHAISFEPNSGLEVISWDDLPVVRPIVRRRPIVESANALGELVVQSVGDVAGTGEHHVLEKVREACPAGHLVLRANVVPHVHHYRGHGVIWRQDDIESVRKLIMLERNADFTASSVARWLLRRCYVSGGNHGGDRHGCAEPIRPRRGSTDPRHYAGPMLRCQARIERGDRSMARRASYQARWMRVR